jgi:hypothetical protein
MNLIEASARSVGSVDTRQLDWCTVRSRRVRSIGQHRVIGYEWAGTCADAVGDAWARLDSVSWLGGLVYVMDQ